MGTDGRFDLMAHLPGRQRGAPQQISRGIVYDDLQFAEAARSSFSSRWLTRDLINRWRAPPPLPGHGGKLAILRPRLRLRAASSRTTACATSHTRAGTD